MSHICGMQYIFLGAVLLRSQERVTVYHSGFPESLPAYLIIQLEKW